MSNCGDCKETPYMDRIVVYLQSTPLTNTSPDYVSTQLTEGLGFTEKQSRNVIRFASSRGECLIFEGKREDAVKIMEKLSKSGLTCRATPRGMIK